MEMRDMGGNEVVEEVEEDILKLAMKGDIKGLRNMIETGKAGAAYRDEMGITPLHVGASLTGTLQD